MTLFNIGSSCLVAQGFVLFMEEKVIPTKVFPLKSSLCFYFVTQFTACNKSNSLIILTSDIRHKSKYSIAIAMSSWSPSFIHTLFLWLPGDLAVMVWPESSGKAAVSFLSLSGLSVCGFSSHPPVLFGGLCLPAWFRWCLLHW